VTTTAPQVGKEPGKKRGGVLGNTGLYIAVSVAALLFLLPFYLILRNSLSTDPEITGENWKLLPSFQWGNISELFDDPTVDFARSMWNSTVIAVSMTSLGWIDTYRGLIIPGLFSGFTCFLFRQYFLGFPKELEEAARVDGLGYWGAYWRIVVPNSLNFFAAMATITFISGWNAFLWPLVIGQDPSSWTVQVALSSFMTNQTVNFHLIFMATAISILPLVFVFLFLQRWLVQGIAQTGIKG
jgi:multiple sugar transport system permease protein